MADDKDKKAPIIIKRITKVAGGHHGGAWKVAYADFVTAMMAFFLLLWLLATTTPEVRSGIAEYFTPTVGLKDSKGIGFEGGLTPTEPGASRTSLTTPGIVAGQVQGGPQPKPPSQIQDIAAPNQESTGGGIPMPDVSQHQATKKVHDDDPEAQLQESAELKKAGEEIMNAFDRSAEMQQLKKNVIISNTPEGLKVDVVDDPGRPMFVGNSSTMTDTGRSIFKAISGVILRTQNQVAITGHTDTISYPPGATYTSWELSSDRAHATRRFMTENLVEPRRVAKVIGMADQDPLLPKEPQSPRNRRISILLMRGTQVIDPRDAPAQRDLLSVPSVDTDSIKRRPAAAPPPPKPAELLNKAPGDSIFAPQREKQGEQGFMPPPDSKPGMQPAR